MVEKQINIFGGEEPMRGARLVEVLVSPDGTVTAKSINHPERWITFGLRHTGGKPSLVRVAEGVSLEAAEAKQAGERATAILLGQLERGKFAKQNQPELDLL